MKCEKCKCEIETTNGRCMSCHKYDATDYVMIAHKTPRVIALEAEIDRLCAENKKLDLQRRAAWTEIKRKNEIINKCADAIASALGVLPRGFKEYEKCAVVYKIISEVQPDGSVNISNGTPQSLPTNRKRLKQPKSG